MKLHRFLVNPFLKRIGGLLTVLTLVAFTSDSFAASPFVSPQKHSQETVLRLGTYLKPAPLDPFNTIDTISSPLLELMFNRLVRLNAQGEFEPDLAERWEISGDGLIYTFYLKKNIKFQNGSPMTAEDVESSFQLIRDKTVSPAKYKEYEIIKETRALSPEIFQIHLKKSFTPFLVSVWGVYVVPKQPLQPSRQDLEKSASNPIGTGPFQFESQNAAGEIGLRANPFYFEGKPSLEKIHVKVFSSKDQVWAAFLRDEIDIFLYLNPSDYEEIKNNPAFHTYRALSLGIYALMFNLNHNAVKDLKLRQAIAYAINRQEMMELLESEAGVLVSGPFHPESWAYNSAVPQKEYDPQKAKELLKEAGYEEKNGILEKEGVPFFLDLLVNPKAAPMVNRAKVIRQQLQEIGIRVRFHFFSDYAELSRKLFQESSGFQCYLLEMNTGGAEPGSVRQYWSSRGIVNLSRYQNLKIDFLFEEIHKTYFREKQQAAYAAIHAEIAQDQPAVFLYAPYVFHALSSRFSEAPFLSSAFFRPYMLKDIAPLEVSTNERR